jgi:hypothetical protein
MQHSLARRDFIFLLEAMICCEYSIVQSPRNVDAWCLLHSLYSSATVKTVGIVQQSAKMDSPLIAAFVTGVSSLNDNNFDGISSVSSQPCNELEQVHQRSLYLAKLQHHFHAVQQKHHSSLGQLPCLHSSLYLQYYQKLVEDLERHSAQLNEVPSQCSSKGSTFGESGDRTRDECILNRLQELYLCGEPRRRVAQQFSLILQQYNDTDDADSLSNLESTDANPINL